MSLLSQVLKVRDLVDEDHPEGTLPYRINHIRDAIVRITNIDRIEFVAVDDGENPIYGEYRRYDRSCGVYAPQETQVDVLYNASLNRCWQRFVICKEMCHALEEDAVTRVTGEDELDQLVESLALPEKSRIALSPFLPFACEKFAEFAAMELLCPLPQRKKIVSRRRAHDHISDMHIATEFRVPVKYVSVFEPKYIEMVEELFRHAAA